MPDNAVGRKAQRRKKCAVSEVLDEVFPEEKLESFVIPYEGRHIFEYQMMQAREIGTYEPLPDHSITESLEAGIPVPVSKDEQLEFYQDPEDGWHSVRS